MRKDPGRQGALLIAYTPGLGYTKEDLPNKRRCMPTLSFRFLLCAMCVYLLYGCEQGDAPVSPSSQAAQNPAARVLIWPLSASVTSFDPISATNTPEVTVARQIFDTLVRFDDQSLSIAPGIARKWEVDPTGKEYVFHLKPGLVFHNGAALTATEVKRSLERLARAGQKTFLYKHLKVIEGCEVFNKGLVNEISGIQVLDSLQLRILLSRPHAPFLPALGICQAGIVHIPDNARQAENTHLVVGSGPFIVETVDDKSITMRPFTRFVDGAPRIDRLVFKIYTGSDINRAAEDFLAGELSAVPVFGPVESMLRERANNYTLIRRRSIGLFYYGFNMRENARLNAGMRRRIAQVIDKRSLLASNTSFLAETIIPLGLPGYRPHGATPAQHKDNAPLPAIPKHLCMLSVSPNTVDKAKMAYLADRLRTLGAELQVEYTSDWSEFYKRLSTGSFDMFSLAWYPDTPDLDEMFYPLFHSQGEYNHSGYVNPRVDALLEQARAISRMEERIALYQQAEDILLFDLPIIPISYATLDRAVQPRVHGLGWSPFGEFYISFASVWIE